MQVESEVDCSFKSYWIKGVLDIRSVKALITATSVLLI